MTTTSSINLRVLSALSICVSTEEIRGPKSAEIGRPAWLDAPQVELAKAA